MWCVCYRSFSMSMSMIMYFMIYLNSWNIELSGVVSYVSCFTVLEEIDRTHYVATD
ncbi:hypothetical protein BJX62DRAFT_220209 [Aspergillus germanicus]